MPRYNAARMRMSRPRDIGLWSIWLILPMTPAVALAQGEALSVPHRISGMLPAP